MIIWEKRRVAMGGLSRRSKRIKANKSSKEKVSSFHFISFHCCTALWVWVELGAIFLVTIACFSFARGSTSASTLHQLCMPLRGSSWPRQGRRALPTTSCGRRDHALTSQGLTRDNLHEQVPGDPAQATPTDLDEADSILRRVRCPELYPGAREVVDRVHSPTALSLSLSLSLLFLSIHTFGLWWCWWWCECAKWRYYVKME